MQKISAALVKAQRAFEPARKTAKNPHFRSQYAALDVCVDAVLPALNDNGIALVQQTHECADGVIVETLFIHESGEQISAGKLHVPAIKQDPQAYGSALTYARRYSLLAACGIAPEDDDGNAASKPAKGPQPSSEPGQKINEKQQQKLKAMIADAHMTVENVNEMRAALGVASLADLDPHDGMDAAVAYIKHFAGRPL